MELLPLLLAADRGDKRPINREYLRSICIVLNTADYSLTTTSQVHFSVKFLAICWIGCLRASSNHFFSFCEI
jgi:hypothetical protein